MLLPTKMLLSNKKSQILWQDFKNLLFSQEKLKTYSVFGHAQVLKCTEDIYIFLIS